jgi:hypothetical protein
MRSVLWSCILLHEVCPLELYSTRLGVPLDLYSNDVCPLELYSIEMCPLELYSTSSDLSSGAVFYCVRCVLWTCILLHEVCPLELY